MIYFLIVYFLFATGFTAYSVYATIEAFAVKKFAEMRPSAVLLLVQCVLVWLYFYVKLCEGIAL